MRALVCCPAFGGDEDALWLTVSGLGDRDTTCAIVGSIVVLSAGIESIPLARVGGGAGDAAGVAFRRR